MQNLCKKKVGNKVNKLLALKNTKKNIESKTETDLIITWLLASISLANVKVLINKYRMKGYWSGESECRIGIVKSGKERGNESMRLGWVSEKEKN